MRLMIRKLNNKNKTKSFLKTLQAMRVMIKKLKKNNKLGNLLKTLQAMKVKRCNQIIKLLKKKKKFNRIRIYKRRIKKILRKLITLNKITINLKIKKHLSKMIPKAKKIKKMY